MKSFGAPVDFVSEQKELTEYPVVIAPAYQLADKELVNKWIAYVKNGGNLVLTCRTAQKDRYGRLPEAPFGSMITPLTGNEMNFYDLLLPEDPGTVVMNGKQYAWNTWGEILIPASDSQVGRRMPMNSMKVVLLSRSENWVRALLHMSELTATMVRWKRIS